MVLRIQAYGGLGINWRQGSLEAIAHTAKEEEEHETSAKASFPSGAWLGQTWLITILTRSASLSM